MDFRTFLENMKMSSSLSKIPETGINVFKSNYQIIKNTKIMKYYEYIRTQFWSEGFESDIVIFTCKVSGNFTYSPFKPLSEILDAFLFNHSQNPFLYFMNPFYFLTCLQEKYDEICEAVFNISRNTQLCKNPHVQASNLVRSRSFRAMWF